jgi:hypothetical protein
VPLPDSGIRDEGLGIKVRVGSRSGRLVLRDASHQEIISGLCLGSVLTSIQTLVNTQQSRICGLYVAHTVVCPHASNHKVAGRGKFHVRVDLSAPVGERQTGGSIPPGSEEGDGLQ